MSGIRPCSNVENSNSEKAVFLPLAETYAVLTKVARVVTPFFVVMFYLVPVVGWTTFAVVCIVYSRQGKVHYVAAAILLPLGSIEWGIFQEGTLRKFFPTLDQVGGSPTEGQIQDSQPLLVVNDDEQKHVLEESFRAHCEDTVRDFLESDKDAFIEDFQQQVVKKMKSLKGQSPTMLAQFDRDYQPGNGYSLSFRDDTKTFDSSEACLRKIQEEVNEDVAWSKALQAMCSQLAPVNLIGNSILNTIQMKAMPDFCFFEKGLEKKFGVKQQPTHFAIAVKKGGAPVPSIESIEIEMKGRLFCEEECPVGHKDLQAKLQNRDLGFHIESTITWKAGLDSFSQPKLSVFSFNVEVVPSKVD